ncbi:thiolase family protein [bacterium]|nr:thiolase family protein [bacterium]
MGQKKMRHKGESGESGSGHSRVAVVGAVRTPFVRSFGVFERETPLSLSIRPAVEVIARTGANASDIDEVIWGAVVPQTKNPNIARDLALFAGLPKSIPGYTLNRACASSLQCVQLAADAIAAGRNRMVLAGGVEVLSDVPITFSDEARRFLTRLSRTKTIREKLMMLSEFNPKAFLPNPPALAEPYTGFTMGEHGEQMAVKNDITRERQDELAVRSHHRAAAAMENGFLKDEVVPIWSGAAKENFVDADNLVRGDTSLEALAKLKPAFDKRNGTLTAGNSSALTDGASAVLLANSSYAEEHGLPVLGYIVDSVTVAVDPKDQLLIGPAYAIPKLLMKSNLKLSDIGVFEIHEAFAAQVLSCLDAMSSTRFCQEKLGLDEAFGGIDPSKMNIDGGSIAYGHPFGATGGRLVGRALRIAQRTGARFAVVAICAAGGMGQAMLLETTQN